MKRLSIILTVLTVVFLFCVPAFALSDSEYYKMKKDPDFATADRELTRVYNQAKDSMNKQDFAKLRDSQRNWISYGRDKRAKELMKQNYSRVYAYTTATLERVQYIKNELTLASLNTDDYTGYFDNGDDVYLYVGWKNRAKKILSVSLSSYDEKWEGEGQLDGHVLIAYYGTTTATLTFIDGDTIRIKPNSAFRRAVGFDAEGRYNRHYGK